MAHQFDVAGHRRKRPAEGELDNQPLAKKFGRLQIGPPTGFRMPEVREEQGRRPRNLYESNDPMMLENTKSTVYIHDLERELAESEALDQSLTILPGLEGKLSMTKMLVANNKQRQCSELVLYREPESLSIPKDKDQVRQALMETRERARLAQQGVQCGVQQKNAERTNSSSWPIDECQQTDILYDQMDIDVNL
ncbi:hypothetical protein BDV19DRAFT_357121 [Aspergillus venezuelensis]